MGAHSCRRLTVLNFNAFCLAIIFRGSFDELFSTEICGKLANKTNRGAKMRPKTKVIVIVSSQQKALIILPKIEIEKLIGKLDVCPSKVPSPSCYVNMHFFYNARCSHFAICQILVP